MLRFGLFVISALFSFDSSVDVNDEDDDDVVDDDDDDMVHWFLLH